MTDGVALQGIIKSYAGTQVLHGISLSFTPGTVYGLVGENGAGKSTLMKILTGIERPTAGSVLVDGESVELRTPADALARQISIISQELTTVPARSVLDNVFLGSWSRRGGFLRGAADRLRYEALCEQVGFRLDPDRIVGTMSIAEQQQVEILRAVSRGSRLLVMDEPTAVLTDSETKALLELVRRLAGRGVIVILVSHFLEEILAVADQVTVLRDGHHILSGPASEQTTDSLVTAMAGREVDTMFPELPPVPEDAPLVLQATGLTRGAAVRGIDVSVRAGEIVGLAGLVGSGRTEVARLIFGADKLEEGRLRVDGRDIIVRTPAAAMRAGIAMVPESRKDQGLHLNQSIVNNVTLPSMARLARWGLRRASAERALARDSVQRFRVKGANLFGPVWTLSGGNQQKVLFAKWVARRPRLLIVDEPTRGVDVGAKAEIHRLLAELAADGMAVLLISSEIDEVINMSHRVLVLRQGRVTAELTAAQANPERVLAAAFADREELR